MERNLDTGMDRVANEAPARPEGDYSFGETAATIYDHLSANRDAILDRGRAMARLTIPHVFPPEGYMAGDTPVEVNQSIGSLVVGSLASKLMFMAFPPDQPCLRYDVIEHKMRAEIDANPMLAIEIDVGLSRLEQAHRKRLEGTSIRAAYTGASKALLIGGNICWSHLNINRPMFYLPTHYVVQRDSEGEALTTIVKQTKYLNTLPKAIQTQILEASEEKFRDTPAYKRQADIYMVCRRRLDGNDKPYWEYWEEYNGVLLNGTEFDSDYETPPLYPAWMIPMYGQNWGPSYCELFEGDLMKVEGHSAALNDGTAMAAMAWLFVAPGSRTTARQLKRAGNLTVHVGVASDLTMGPSMEGKVRDYTFIANDLETAARRLDRAFLTMSSVQRQAERVTAEEVALMAKELNEATGGLYAEVSQSFQRNVVARFVVLHNEEDKQLPKMPPNVFRVAVITGVEQHGRSAEGQTLHRETATAMEVSGGKVAQYIDWHAYLRRIYASSAIAQDGIVRTPQAQAAFEANAKKDMMQQTMMDKGVGPAVTAIGKQLPPGAMMPPGNEGQPPTQPPTDGVPQQ